MLGLPAPFVPHSASLSPATATRVLSTPVPSPPLLPVWMNDYFLFPWCWSPLLFDSLSVLVVRGGAVCLPTPPSWFSPLIFINNFTSRFFQTGKLLFNLFCIIIYIQFVTRAHFKCVSFVSPLSPRTRYFNLRTGILYYAALCFFTTLNIPYSNV